MMNHKQTLLLTGAFVYTKEQLELLRSFSWVHDLFYAPDEKHLDIDPAQVDVAVCNGLFLYHDIALFERLKYIQLTSAGFDRVPLQYIREHGIVIKNARGVYDIPIAEYVISNVLQFYKQSRFFALKKEQKRWEKRRDMEEIFGKTICIVGAGSIGTQIACLFQAFGANIIGVDLAAGTNEYFDAIVPLTDLNSVLTKSDIVVLTLPLNDATRHMFDVSRLSAMKSNALLVNVARGALIDESALCETLKNDGIRGAILDVFETEPLPDTHPLWKMDNVILTPHVSFISDKNYQRLFQLIHSNLTGQFGS